jgi:hypothetical protein
MEGAASNGALHAFKGIVGSSARTLVALAPGTLSHLVRNAPVHPWMQVGLDRARVLRTRRTSLP